MNKRRVKKAYKKISEGRGITILEKKGILHNYHRFFTLFLNARFKYLSGELTKFPICHMSINPFIETDLKLPEHINEPDPDNNHQKFIDYVTEQVAIIYQVPIEMVQGGYIRNENKKEVKMNIFKKEYGESYSVEDRIYDVKSCNNLDILTETLNKQGLQKTVEKAILSKIKRLKKEEK